MKIPKELIETWWGAHAPIDYEDLEYIAQRAYDYALSQSVSMEPVAWRDKHNKFDFYTKTFNQLDTEPLYTAAQLAAARQQGAEEERERIMAANEPVLRGINKHIAELEEDRKKLISVNDWCKEFWDERAHGFILKQRIAELEKSNAVLLEALKYHQEQTRPIQRTIDAIAAAEVKP